MECDSLGAGGFQSIREVNAGLNIEGVHMGTREYLTSRVLKVRINSGNVFFSVSCVLVKDFSIIFWNKFSSSSPIKECFVSLLVLLCCWFFSPHLFLLFLYGHSRPGVR